MNAPLVSTAAAFAPAGARVGVERDGAVRRRRPQDGARGRHGRLEADGLRSAERAALGLEAPERERDIQT